MYDDYRATYKRGSISSTNIIVLTNGRYILLCNRATFPPVFSRCYQPLELVSIEMDVEMWLKLCGTPS